MNENFTPEMEPAIPTKLDVAVRVYPSKTEGNPLAYASVTLGGCFAIKGIRIMDSEKGTFVAMPDRKDNKGEYHEVCFPTTAEMRETLNTSVMGEYHRVVELITAQGEKALAPVPDAPQEAPRASAPKKASKTRKADRGAR